MSGAPAMRRLRRLAALSRGLFLPDRRNPVVHRLLGRLNELHHQRDQLRHQRDRARERHEELKVDFQALANELADAGGRFTALDYHGGEVERARQRPEIEARAAAGEQLAVREREVLLERVAPHFALTTPERATPGRDVAFVTVASDQFAPGLEALVRSLKMVYPDLQSDIHVYHDGTISDFVQRRLKRIHDRILFTQPPMDWMDQVPDESPNHRRIGRLGYMNIHGLGLVGYHRVILLDADLLVLDDISRLWRGDDWIVCADCGDRDYAVRSPVTGATVFNSGVISVPGAATGPEALAEIIALTREYAARSVCSTIDRFADQKIWNLYLKGKPKDYAPVNYNCTIKYLARALDGHAEAVSVLHFAGPKPWVSPSYLPVELIASMAHTGFNHPRFWTDHHRHQLLGARLAGFRRAIRGRRSAPRRPNATSCVLLPEAFGGLSPSLAGGRETIVFDEGVFNYGFAALQPDHVVFCSHELLGGWLTQRPSFPPGLLARLRAASGHRPALWFPFYFRELVEAEGLESEFEINYLLFEEPFRRFVDQTGRYDPDPQGFLDDARSPALTMGVPAALAMGFTSIVMPSQPPADERAAMIAELAVETLAERGVTLEMVDRRRDAA